MAMVRLGKLKIRFQNGGVDFRLGDGEVRHFGLGRKSAGTDEAQPYSEDSSLNAQDADPGYGGRFSGYDDGYGDDYDDRDAGYDDGYGDDYDDRDAGYGLSLVHIWFRNFRSFRARILLSLGPYPNI